MRFSFFFAVLVGCSSTSTAEPTDAAIDVPPIACMSGGSECGPQGYCNAVDCKSMGTCAVRPALDAGGVFGQACGCADGITYWSAAYAAAHGTASVSGACDGPTMGSHPPAKTCAVDTDCAIVGMRCVSIGCGGREASCWSIPAVTSCPADSMPLKGWETCDHSLTCLTECEALRTGLPFDTGDICR